jgi:hypothetical protein
MPVPYQMVDFEMNGKLDMWSDEMDVAPPNLIKNENTIITAPGAFAMRPGFVTLSGTVGAAGSTTYKNQGDIGYYASDASGATGNLLTDTPPAVHAYKKQLVSQHRNRVMVHDTNNTSSIPQHVGRHFAHVLEPGAANDTDGSGLVRVGGFICKIKYTSTLELDVYEANTGVQIVKRFTVATPFAAKFAIAAGDTHVAIAYCSAATEVTIKFYSVLTMATAGPVAANTQVITDVYGGSAGVWDLYGTTDTVTTPFHFAYFAATPTTFSIKRYSLAGAASTTWSGAATTAPTATGKLRTTFISGSGYYIIANTNASTNVRITGFNTTLTATLFAPTAILTTFTGTWDPRVGAVGGYELALGVDNSSGTTYLRTWVCGERAANNRVSTCSGVFNVATGAEISTSARDIVYNHIICSRAVEINGAPCLILRDYYYISGTNSGTPPDIYYKLVCFEYSTIVSLSVSSKTAPWVIGKFGNYPYTIQGSSSLGLPPIYDLYVRRYSGGSLIDNTDGTGGELNFGYIRASQSAIGYEFVHLKIDLSHGSRYSYQATEIGETLYLSGASPSYFDGRDVVECGFSSLPHISTMADLGGGGSVPVGTLNVTATFERIDANGRVYRSLPCPPATIVNATPTTRIRVDCAPCTFTKQRDSTGRVFVRVWRTTVANPTTYFEAGSAAYASALPSADLISITLTDSDATVSSRATLYTTGGVLDNDPWPSTGAICSYQGRLVIHDTENDRLLYTKSATQDEGCEISTFNEITFNAPGSPITSVKSVDQLLVLFCRTATYVTSGQVNNDLGQGGQFSEWQPTSQTIGCTYPRAMAQTSDGVFFPSNQGVQLFAQAQLAPIGLPVSPYNAYSFLGATVFEANNRKHVIFCTYDGTNSVLLIYDLLNQTWLIWKSATTGYFSGVCAPASSSTPYYGLYGSAKPPKIMKELSGTFAYMDTNPFTPAAVAITSVIRTGWINFANRQSLVRLRRVLALLDSKLASGTQNVAVKIYRDFDDTLNETATYAVTFALTPTGVPAQFRVRTSKQKVQTVSIEITTVPETSFYQSGPTISGLSLEVGQRGGAARLPANKTQNV